MTDLRAGFGRIDITVFDANQSMWGWGYADNVSRSVAMPLHARAVVLERNGRRVAYVCCDLALISQSVREHVVAAVEALDLGLDAASIAITATHTHSGPSGFSSFLFYAIPGPGLSVRVHDTIVARLVAVIRDAVDALRPACAWVHHGQVPDTEPIAFNRAIRSHARNRDVHTPVPRPEHAVDRTMTVLRVDSAHGEPLGLVSWFGVHGTCVHREATAIHPDHKGIAATRVEAEARDAGAVDFVAVFAQACAGDVTSNHRWDASRGLSVGAHRDDLDHAEHVGRVQADVARALADAAARDGVSLDGPLAGHLSWTDFFDAPGVDGTRTTEPVVGWAFSGGTAEGPGPFRALRPLAPVVARLRARHVRRRGSEVARGHGVKVPFWELGRGRAGRISGVLPADSRLLALVPSPHVRYYLRAVRHPVTAALPFVPRHLPGQLLRLGPLVIALLPKEVTTQSGRRLADTITGVLGPDARVVVNGYANAYASYLTTPEEYDAQDYEGACTMFGRASLPAWQQVFRDLAHDLRDGGPRERGERPALRRPEDLLPPTPDDAVVG